MRGWRLTWVSCLALLTACASDMGESEGRAGVSLDYEKYELANGLDVVLHVDRSDPVAAVAMSFHVGSSREVAGRTGFAHLFEHLFFLDSENLGPGGLDRLMTRVGSSTNGFTTRDQTNYFEVVPRDALEKAIWAEADKLGYFINTVSESVLAKEQQVVKNEKRQGVDNQPYGHNAYVVDRAIYPEGHPYRWQVIGSLADLDAATVADVKEFHSRWYGPNNATLVVAGDIDVERTKEWIETYFGEVPARPLPERAEPPQVRLSESRRLMHEDNFARLPQLTLDWPTVPLYHPDSYPLDVLADLLTDGRQSPFYDVIVEEAEVAPGVTATNRAQELSGQFRIQVRAFPQIDLDTVMVAVERAFQRFETAGVVASELERVKAGYETATYGQLSSVLGKAFQLAQYNTFAPSPGYVSEDLQRLLDVTAEDVTRVYEQYIRGRPMVAASFVPRGAAELALEGSERAEVVEEPIVQGAEDAVQVADRGDVLRTPSSFDRSVEPPFGSAPSVPVPQVQRAALSNGLQILAIEDHETPLVAFELRIPGGALLDDPAHGGTANLLAETMTEGTAGRTAEELEQAIDQLGATINVRATREAVSIRGNTLSRNYAATMALVAEILLEPRWDPDRFEQAKQRVQNGLRQRSANPSALAVDAFGRIVYGDHPLAKNPAGDLTSVEGLTLADLQEYHGRALVPGGAALMVSGDVAMSGVEDAVRALAERWTGEASVLPEPPQWSPERAGVYFIDVPGAVQSVLRVGFLALPETDPDFYPATVMNFRLGGGGFASDLTQVLREQNGYTYGIGSGFSGTNYPGPFQIASSVRANVTYESLELIKGLVERHGPDFDAEDLAATQGFLLKNNAGAFETLAAKLGVLADMHDYGFPADYVQARERVVREMTIARVQELGARFLDPSGMVWLVVGDAATQRDRLRDLGLGEPITLQREGPPAS